MQTCIDLFDITSNLCLLSNGKVSTFFKPNQIKIEKKVRVVVTNSLIKFVLVGSPALFIGKQLQQHNKVTTNVYRILRIGQCNNKVVVV